MRKTAYQRRYYYSQLERRLQRITDKIVNALRHHQAEVLLMQPVTYQEIASVMYVIDKDFPEIFYLDTKLNVFQVTDFGFFKKLKFSFAYQPDQIKMLEKRLARMTEQILTCDLEISGKSPHAREEAIYQYLCGRVRYNERARGLEDYTIVGALMNGTAVCEGYAKAFAYLCERADISCLVVVGTARQQLFGTVEAHAWNIVCLGEENAHVDVTWDGMNPEFPCAYFNVGDDTMRNDHWWDASLVPCCDSSIESRLPMIASTRELARFFVRNLAIGRRTMLFKLNRKFDMPALCALIDRALNGLDAAARYQIDNYAVQEKQLGRVSIVHIEFKTH